MNEEETPLLIKVKGNHWYSYPQDGFRMTDREQWLLKYFIENGGTGQGEPDGLYYFNIVALDSETDVISLDPVIEEELPQAEAHILRVNDQIGEDPTA